MNESTEKKQPNADASRVPLDCIVSSDQLWIMEHALGNKSHYRNHYMTDPNCDGWQEIVDLCKKGLMKSVPVNPSIYNGLVCFRVTEEGKKLCFANSGVRCHSDMRTNKD